MADILLLISLLLGQFGRVQITPHIALYIQDVVLFVYILSKYKRSISVIRKRSSLYPVWQTIGILGLSLCLNVWRYASSEIIVGMLYLLRFSLYAGFYYVVKTDNHKSSYWYTWLYILGIGYVILGYFQMLIYPNLRNLMYLGWDPHYNRLFSTLFDPNYVGLLFTLSLVLGFTKPIFRSKALMTISQGVLALGLALTFSRGSLIAFIASLIVFIVFTRRWKLLILGLGVILLGLFLSPIGGISTSLTRLWSISSRWATFQESFQLILQSPIIGYGFNMLRFIPHIGLVSPYGYIANSAGGVDNSLLFLILTTGCLSVGILSLWLKAFQVITNTLLSNSKTRVLFYSSSIALAIHGMTTNSWFYPVIVLWFSILFSAIEKEGKK